MVELQQRLPGFTSGEIKLSKKHCCGHCKEHEGCKFMGNDYCHVSFPVEDKGSLIGRMLMIWR